jgi:transposase
LRGQTPVVQVAGRRAAVNAISAVNERGAFWYCTFTGRLNATSFIGFLAKFLRRRRAPVMLIVDSHPAHTAKAVGRHVQASRGRLEMYFLPGYSPELNPDEFVWHHIKTNGISKKPLRKGECLRARVEADLADVKRSPTLVRSFFHAPSVDYIMN